MINPRRNLHILYNLNNPHPDIIDIVYSSYKDFENLPDLDDVYTYIGEYNDIYHYFTLCVDDVSEYKLLEPRGIRYNDEDTFFEIPLRYEFYQNYRNQNLTIIL